MKFERWMPPTMALMCLAVAAVFWVMGADAAADPAGRPWYVEWYVGFLGVETCVVLAFIFVSTWIQDLRDARREEMHASHHLRGRIEKPFWVIAVLGMTLTTISCGL